MTLTCTPSQTVGGVCPITTGEQEIKKLSLTSNEIWLPLVVMAGLIIVLRVLSLAFLVIQMRRLMSKSQ